MKGTLVLHTGNGGMALRAVRFDALPYPGQLWSAGGTGVTAQTRNWNVMVKNMTSLVSPDGNMHITFRTETDDMFMLHVPVQPKGLFKHDCDSDTYLGHVVFTEDGQPGSKEVAADLYLQCGKHSVSARWSNTPSDYHTAPLDAKCVSPHLAAAQALARALPRMAASEKGVPTKWDI
jgi:hypothetical protein